MTIATWLVLITAALTAWVLLGLFVGLAVVRRWQRERDEARADYQRTVRAELHRVMREVKP